jgi:hypothetical protein
MKSLVVAILMTVISCACFAQDSAEYRACSDKANTQSEMTACTSDEAARVDAKLNATYRALLARVASQPKALAKLKQPKEPGSPTATPISKLLTRPKIKPSSTAPSILSKLLCFEPSPHSAKSPPSKICFSVTHPNSISAAHAPKARVARKLEPQTDNGTY